MPDSAPRGDPPPLLGMRKTLAELEAAVVQGGGSASPRAVLGELARRLACDVAGYFDDLPLPLFTGYVARGSGPLRSVLPARAVPHRVLLARHKAMARWFRQPMAPGRRSLAIDVLALGVDGLLRRGTWNGIVPFSEREAILPELLSGSHPHLAGVARGRVLLTAWTGTDKPDDVADPGAVIVALKEVASRLAESNARDLELLRRHL